MHPVLLSPFAFFLIFLVFVAIWGISRSLTPPTEALKGDESFHREKSFTVTMGSNQVFYRYSPPKRTKNAVTKRKLYVEVERTSPVTLYLYAQTDMDEWMFKTGFAEELTLGIPWLDNQFNISTSDDSATRTFLAREDVQNLLRKVISRSFVAFSIEPKGSSILLENFDPTEYENLDQLIQKQVQILAEFTPMIRENFQNSSLAAATKLSRHHQILQSVGFSGSLFILIMGLYIGMIIFYRAYEPLHALDTFSFFMLIALALFLVFLFAIRPVLRKLTLPGREIKRVFIMFMLGTWMMILFGLLYVNVKMDNSPVQKISERVLLKWIDHSSKGNHQYYMISYEAPTPAHIGWHKDIVDSQLSYQEWKNVRQDRDNINLELRQGYFGVPWIQSHWFSDKKDKNSWSE